MENDPYQISRKKKWEKRLDDPKPLSKWEKIVLFTVYLKTVKDPYFHAKVIKRLFK